MPSIGTEIRSRGVSVVLGTYNRKAFLKLTMDSVRKELQTAQIPHEIITIDGGSTDGTIGWLAKQKDVISIIQHNRGKGNGKPIEQRSWGYFINIAFKIAQGKYICMLSDDCLVVPGAIKNGVAYFEKRLSEGVNLGAVPFYFIQNYPMGTDYAVAKVGKYIYVNHGMFLNEALGSVGYVDEESYSFYWADVDLCLRMISKGYCVEACPDSKVIHFEHINKKVRESNLARMESDTRVFESKWSHVWNDSGSLQSAASLMMLQNERFSDDDLYKRSFALRLIIMRSLVPVKLARIKVIRIIMRILRRYLLTSKH